MPVRFGQKAQRFDHIQSRLLPLIVAPICSVLDLA